MTFSHGGHLRQLAERAGCRPEEILDFSASINPLGPPCALRSTVARTLDSVIHYPDPECAEFVRVAASQAGVSPKQIIAGNGSTELLYATAKAIKRPRAVIPVPSYSDYVDAVQLACKDVELMRLDESSEFALDWEALGSRLRGDELVILGRPNNPTGVAFDADEFYQFAEERPDAVIVVDEAFADFADDLEPVTSGLPENVIVLRSLTKFYAIPGLRLGYAVAPPRWTSSLREQLPPWSVNTLAQAVGSAALQDSDFAQETRQVVLRAREQLHDDLGAIAGLNVFPSCANFLLVELQRSDLDSTAIASRLLTERIALRDCSSFAGLDSRFFRVAVRRPEENARLVDALHGILDSPAQKRQKRTKRTPAIMIQGTSSNAGKSVLAAAMCRVLLQDGVRVAPFKSQNMSLNSFVTADGGEMGRAQVVQAQACRLSPDVRMNPVLLKPNSDTGSQVIVKGQPVGNMRVGEYIRFKSQVFTEIQACYDSLATEFDAVVLEGAGSPAEVNLKSHDIVNMRMARHAEAPVLLVGDIDRGGIFASFVGTMELLTLEERRQVHGFLINRFRGDASLLGPAIDFTEAHTGKPTLGVVPYLPDLGLPEEDSVEFKGGRSVQPSDTNEMLDIAVIDLPHISNFTDIDALDIEPDTHVRVVRSVEGLGSPNAILLPGSKSVLNDLAYLRRSGLASALLEIAVAGSAVVVGICGGFQMLGRRIADPCHIESHNDESEALGLLNLTTTHAAEKTLARSKAVHLASGCEVVGYEIHHGQTELHGSERLFHTDAADLGATNQQGDVWGTYLHGLFDADRFRRWFLDRLRERRGLPPLGGVTATYDIEPALNRLADVVRQNVDIDAIYQRMGL